MWNEPNCNFANSQLYCYPWKQHKVSHQREPQEIGFKTRVKAERMSNFDCLTAIIMQDYTHFRLVL